MKKLNRPTHVLLSILASVGIVALPVSFKDFTHTGHSMLSIAQADVPAGTETPGGGQPIGTCCGAGASGNGCDGCDGCSE